MLLLYRTVLIYFNSHASCEARHSRSIIILRHIISTHTPHARRDDRLTGNKNAYSISTHTPHARRDGIENRLPKNLHNFNSHASCEARQKLCDNMSAAFQFQLTRLMRGATSRCRICQSVCSISTHTPHARRDGIVISHFSSAS